MSTPKNVPNLVRVVDGLLKSFKNIKQQAGGISVMLLCVPSGAGTENYWPKLIPCKKHKYDVAAYANNDCSKLVSFAVYGKNIAAWPDLEALCEQAAKALLLIQPPQNVPGPIGIVKIWKRLSSLIGKEPTGADNVAPSIISWFEFLFHAGREVGSRLGRPPSTVSRPGLPEADVRELGCDIVEASIIVLEQVISAAVIPAAIPIESASSLPDRTVTKEPSVQAKQCPIEASIVTSSRDIDSVPVPNPSEPMSIKMAAGQWGGQMTSKKLKVLMKSNKIKYRTLNRQTYIFCCDDCPGLQKAKLPK